jgi:ABC-type multidrug transport system ATPase subunit
MLAIETNGLTKRLSGRTVVSDVSLKVPLKSVYCFLGPNGAGKTTTMRLLLGLLGADGGSIHLLGRDLSLSRREILAQVGALVERPSLYDHLSGYDNLELTRRMLSLPVLEIDRVLEVVSLRQQARKTVRDFSLGMKQRLAIARALLGAPKLLLLDEPTNGLDPDGIIGMRALIRDLPERISGTVFVCSHLLAEVELIADHAGFMSNGRLIAQDTVANLKSGQTTAEIETDRVTAAVALLRANGFDVASASNNSVCVDVAGCDPEAQLAAANRVLVESGHAVWSIMRKSRSIERIYRTLLGDASEGVLPS